MSSWTVDQMRSALHEYETELRQQGKALNTTASYVTGADRFLNWLSQQRPGASAPVASKPASSGYEALAAWLDTKSEVVVAMSFAEVERVMGRALPASARRHRAWWANDRGGTHSHARAWLDAGRLTEDVDLNVGMVQFRRQTTQVNRGGKTA